MIVVCGCSATLRDLGRCEVGRSGKLEEGGFVSIISCSWQKTNNDRAHGVSRHGV